MTEQKTPVQSTVRKIIMFPLVRAIIAIVMVVVATMVIGNILKWVGSSLFGETPPELWRLLANIIVVIFACLSYSAFVIYIERRKESELALDGALKETGLGVAIGAGLIAAVVGIIWVAGSYQVHSVNDLQALIKPFYTSLSAGVIEEIIFRAIIFRIMQESLGSWIAIAFSALFFGFGHAANPNATLFSSIAIALEAGILLAAAFMFTRRLWMVIGIHFAWNFTQGGIFGVAVSGHEITGLLQSEMSGPELVTGGAFGAEASIFALIICTGTGLYMLWKAWERGHFIKPFWLR
ncbi:MAG: CPBP family intramembrane metalloprotease [Calditrichaeota bacterium]|nr:MAG: CPBP family intramembrane metalloprotease [Calditrichota bacterium]